jgi:hypothetical protein
MEAQDNSVSSRHQTHSAEKDWIAQGLSLHLIRSK